MDVQEILRLADDLVFAKTGEHLDDLQEAILRGVWEGQKYSQIAETSYCSEGHIRNIASKLWKRLSNVLDEEVTQSNLRSTLERLQISIISSNFAKDFAQINNINICGDTLQTSEIPKTRSHSTPNPENHTPQTRQDLTDAPQITSFYNRISELTTLEQWIVQQNCNLIAILGISGIGKTALTLHLLPQIQHQFQYIIWRNLRTSPSLETTIKNLIKFFTNEPENQLPTSIDDQLSLLIQHLKSYPSLIIFDDLQTLFSNNQLAGQYRQNYENYSTLFRLIAETTHNSCLILNSWEPPREIVTLTGENTPIRTLKLHSLGAASAEILKEKALLDTEKWETLINTYQGNPLWLKIVATMIQELFQGRVAEFFNYDILFLGEELKAVLHPQFQRLSELEKQVIFRISSQGEPVSIAELLQNMQISPLELVNAVQSLKWRSLIETKEQENQTLFTIGQVVRQYVKSL
jgi:DNA replication protein DnaC